jgi:hypothetical protein
MAPKVRLDTVRQLTSLARSPVGMWLKSATVAILRDDILYAVPFQPGQEPETFAVQRDVRFG